MPQKSVIEVSSQVKKENEFLQAENKQLAADNTALKQKLEQLEVTSSDLEATVLNLRSQLREKDQVCQDQTNQLSKMKQKISELEKTIERNNDISAKKIKQLEDAERNNMKEFEREKSELRKKIAELEQTSPIVQSTRQQKPLPTKFR